MNHKGFTPDLHGRIMNIQVPSDDDGRAISWTPAYLLGHQHARHAAAELALAADAQP